MLVAGRTGDVRAEWCPDVVPKAEAGEAVQGDRV